jgi:hypothetical protein
MANFAQVRQLFQSEVAHRDAEATGWHFSKTEDAWRVSDESSLRLREQPAANTMKAHGNLQAWSMVTACRLISCLKKECFYRHP